MADGANPIQPGQKATRAQAMDLIGDTGLRGWGGTISEEFLPKLAGLSGARTYQQMVDNDATVGAIIHTLTALTTGVEWNVQPADETDAAKAAAEFVEDVLDDMETPLDDVMTEASTMFTYGFAPMEITFKQRLGPDQEDPRRRSKTADGLIGIRSIALRAQSTLQRWDFNQEDGELRGLFQNATWKKSVYIPRNKLVLFRTTSVKNNPEGRSILRSAYRAWYFKSKLEEIEGIGVERELAGMPVAYIPQMYFDPNAAPEEKAVLEAWRTIVSNIRKDTHKGLVVPSSRDDNGNLNFELKLLTSGGGRSFDTSAIISRYDRAIATSVLMDFLFLGQASVGSFALSSDKTALFAQALGSFLKRMQNTLNRDVIDRLWEMNGLPDELKPTLRAGDIEKQDLMEVSSFLSTMVGAGMQVFPDRATENWVRKLAGMPPAPEEDGLEDQGMPGDEGQPGADDADDEPEEPEAEAPAAKAVAKAAGAVRDAFRDGKVAKARAVIERARRIVESC